jgi:hypothetical protein
MVGSILIAALLTALFIGLVFPRKEEVNKRSKDIEKALRGD